MKKNWRLVLTVVFILLVFYLYPFILLSEEKRSLPQVAFIFPMLSFVFGSLINYQRHYLWLYPVLIMVGAAPMLYLLDSTNGLFYAPFFGIMALIGMALGTAAWKYFNRFIDL